MLFSTLCSPCETRNRCGLGAKNDDRLCRVLKESFWMRNSCYGGYVLAKNNSTIIAQHRGISRYHRSVEIYRETCVQKNSDGALQTRLSFAKSGHYICFNLCGKLSLVPRQRVDIWGNRCMFLEIPTPNRKTFFLVRFQSVMNKSWHLGFQGGLQSIIHGQNNSSFIPPRHMHRYPSTSHNQSISCKTSLYFILKNHKFWLFC